MSHHVRTIVKNVNFHLRSIYRIRRYITIESCHHLVRALILSRLDYANSLMLGISAKDRNQLQKLQNRAVRIVFRAERLHPSAPLLRTLHWLPVDQRIKFKVLLYVFKGVHGLAPPYLNEFLVPYSPGRPNLRYVMTSFSSTIYVPPGDMVTFRFMLMLHDSGTPCSRTYVIAPQL